MLVELVAEVLSRSSLAFSGSPSRFASGLPVAARDSARLSDVSDDARCSFAGSIWARTSVSIAPSRARLTSRSSGLVAQLAREVAQLLGQPGPRISASAPFALEVLGDSSSRSACALGLLADLLLLGDDGVLRVRDERGPARAAARHDGDDGRPRARTAAGTGRRTVRRAASASRRWRRTNRSVSAASSSESVGPRSRSSSCRGPADAGNPTASSRALETRSPRRALGIDRQRRLADGGPRPDARHEPAEQPERPGWPLRRGGADGSGMNRASVHSTSSATTTTASAIQSRRTSRRSQRRRRWDARPLAAATRAGSRGRSGRPPGRPGRPAPVRPRPRRADERAQIRGRHQARPRCSARPRRSRQRRVGDTNWTDSNRKTRTGRTRPRRSSSRARPGAPRMDDVGGRRRRTSAARPPAALAMRASAGQPGRRRGDSPWCRRSPSSPTTSRPSESTGAGIGTGAVRRRWKITPLLRRHESRSIGAPAAEASLRAAQDVDLGDERVQVGERLPAAAP